MRLENSLISGVASLQVTSVNFWPHLVTEEKKVASWALCAVEVRRHTP